MKQLIQDLRRGDTRVEDVPVPLLRPRGVLIRVAASLVSAGTERTAVDFAKKGLLAKARSRPDLVRQTIDKATRDGIAVAFDSVQTRLGQELALGYSIAGTVIEVDEAEGFRPGDRVAAAGAGYAVHAEVVWVPHNLVVHLPPAVSFEAGAFTTLGAIATQGIRLGDSRLGETAGVIGLGLLGQLSVQILKAAGCHVIGFDPRSPRATLAIDLGADVAVSDPDEFVLQCISRTDGRGVDAAYIAADTRSDEPVTLAARAARDKATVVAVGAVGLNLPRKPYYEKELDFRISRSYGPGRYDPSYEESGHDYPFAYVRWTENRNMQAFVELLGEGRIRTEPLVTHRFPIENGVEAYELITSASDVPYMGVVLTYPERAETLRQTVVLHESRAIGVGRVVVGAIGAGSFATAVLLPALKRVEGVELAGVTAASGISARQAANRFGFGYCTTDAGHILADERVNAVFVTTRHHLHAAQTIAALKAGKNVFVEKPLCLTAEELTCIAHAYAEADRILMVGFNRRFAPMAQSLKAFFSGVADPLFISYRVNAGYLAPTHWTQDPEQGGGRLLGEAVHFIDCATWFAASSPVSVQLTTLPDQGRYMQDNFSLTIGFRNGTVAQIQYLANGSPRLGKERLEVHGGGRSGVLEDFRKLTLCAGGRTRVAREWLRQDKGHAAAVATFIDSLRAGAPAPIPFREVVAVMQCAFAARTSMLSGRSDSHCVGPGVRDSVLMETRPAALPLTQARSRLTYLRRVAFVYLFPSRSPLAFWYERPQVNEAAFGEAVGPYYMTFSGKANYRGPFDSDGIPVLAYGGDIGTQYNPIAIAQYGLARYNRFAVTSAVDDRDAFVKNANWLANALEPNRHGVQVWLHHFDWHYRQPLRAPWYSGLAQGQGISLLVRAALSTGLSKYADAADAAFESFRLSTAEGGVIHRDEDGSPWIEEYLVDPPSHILNGFIWALWGVYDYTRWSRDQAASRLFDECARTLAQHLPTYDAGFWSLYESRLGSNRMLASGYYHALHVVQLRVLHRMTGLTVFEEFADRWEALAGRRAARLRAFAEKAWFKLRRY